jgi:hypothetical protein
MTSVMKHDRRKSILGFVIIAALVMGHAGSGHAASDLKLAPDLSFDNDSSSSFPIRGDNLTDASVVADQAIIIFLGTAHCWNTSREAERLVKLYPQYRNRVHFVIVDLNKLAPGQDQLVERYYHGYIPTIAVIDPHGKLLYDRAGETASIRGDTSNLQRILDRAK